MAVEQRGHGWSARLHIGNRKYRRLGVYPTREMAEEALRLGRPLSPQICAMCGLHGADLHHISRDRSDNSDENLIYLCRHHHAKAHSGKLIWEALATIARCDSLDEAHRIAHAALRGTVPEQRPRKGER